MSGALYGTTDGALYGTTDGAIYGTQPPDTTQFRARNPADGSTDSDLYDVKPLRDAFKRFASGATLAFVDRDGTKIDDYPYGQRVEVQYTTDGGSNWITRFAGVTLTPKRTTNDGIPSVEVEVLGYSHLLTRENIIKDYSSQNKDTILKDVIETFTSINWVAGNVNVQDNSSIDVTARGQTPAEIIDHVASRSANEEWGVNQDLEFFFRQQGSERSTGISDGDVIQYDLPEDGKRSINQYRLFYTSNASESVLVEDREAQQDLKDKLGAPRRVVISESDHIPEVTSEAVAKAIADERLGEQTVIQTGTVTLPLGRFETESGDVVDVDISDAGISNTDFRVAQIDYNWLEGVTRATIAENTGGSVTELLVALSDSLTNERLKNADTAPNEVRFLELQSGVTLSRSASATTRTLGGTQYGQAQYGQATYGGGIDSTSSVSIESQKATVALLNLIRDLWQDGNSAFTDLTHVAAGIDDATASRGDSELGNEVDRVPVSTFDAGSAAEAFEITATIPAGGVFGSADNLKEFSVADADTGGNHYARVTFADTTIDASTQLKLRLAITIDVDSTEQGVITSKGQERIRDLVIGESGHEASDMVWGTGTTTATESDTSLGSQSHEDTIDSTEDGPPGVARIIERVLSGDADTTNFSEVGLENSSNELLQRIVYEAYGSDVVVEGILGMKAVNA